MKTTDMAGWATAGLNLWMLGAEAATVMTLRTFRIVAGGAAGAREAELMVTEKAIAGFELQMRFLTGAIGSTPLAATQGYLRHYRPKVAANRKRLTGSLHRRP